MISISHQKHKLFSFFFSVVFMCSAHAQTWQKQKQVTLPLVTENTACNTAIDTIGLASNRTAVLICQSNVWQRSASTSLVVQGPLDSYVGRLTWPINQQFSQLCPTADCSTWSFGASNYPQQFTVVNVGNSIVLNNRFYSLGVGWSEWRTLCTFATTMNCNVSGGATVYQLRAYGLVLTNSGNIYPWAN
jgi:hypothetical protein